MRGLLRASISAVALRGGSTFAADLGPRNSLYVTPIAPIVASNWRATPGQQWTVPVGGGFGRVFKIGDQPVNASIGGYYNAVRPTATPVWQLRASVALLFPVNSLSEAIIPQTHARYRRRRALSPISCGIGGLFEYEVPLAGPFFQNTAGVPVTYCGFFATREGIRQITNAGKAKTVRQTTNFVTDSRIWVLTSACKSLSSVQMTIADPCSEPRKRKSHHRGLSQPPRCCVLASRLRRRQTKAA